MGMLRRSSIKRRVIPSPTCRSGKVVSFRRKNLGIFEAVLGDGSPEKLVAKWFNAAYLADKLVEGVRLALYGKVELDSYTGDLMLKSPEYEILTGDDEEGEASLHTGRVVPIYEACGKITTRVFRSILKRLLDSMGTLEDQLPPSICERLKLPDRTTATRPGPTAPAAPPRGAGRRAATAPARAARRGWTRGR